MTPDAACFEVIVVDNGSSDDTEQTVGAFKDRLPVRLIHEAKVGVANARNTATLAATGKYIVWTDDDTEAQSRWLQGYQDAIARFPDAAFFGGKITPVYEPGGPKWFLDNKDVFRLLSATRDADENNGRPGEKDVDDLPFGANWAVKTDIARAFPFDPELGVSDKQRRGGEESDVMHRMIRAGHQAEWAPVSEVHHHITLARQSLGYIWRFYAGLGEMDAFLEARQAKTSQAARLVRHGRRALKDVVRLVLRRPFVSSRVWTSDYESAAYRTSLAINTLKFRDKRT